MLHPILGKATAVNTESEVAKLAGVSKGTYYEGKKVLDKGTEEVKRQTLSGEKKVHTAYTETVMQEQAKKPTKTCIKCGRELPATEFYKERNVCIKCRSKQISQKQNYIDPELALTPPPATRVRECDL